MKYIIKYIMLFFLMMVNFGQTKEISLSTSTISDLLETSAAITADDSVDLTIRNTGKLKAESINFLLKTPWQLQVSSLTISNVEIEASHLYGLLKMFNEGCIHSLTLENININKHKQFLKIPVIQKLKTLRIINTKLDKMFYIQLAKIADLPLTHLEFISSELNKKHLKYFKDWYVLSQLEYLDLSGNKLENEIFSYLPLESASNLKVLKLNDCGLKITTPFGSKSYTSVSPSLLKKFSKVNHVNWDTKFFEKLEHLELRNKTLTYASIYLLNDIERFHRLKVFYNFYPNFENNTSEQKKEKIYSKIIAKYAESKLSSAFTNYKLGNLAHYNMLLNSDKKEILENLIFAGNNWDEIVIREILSSNQFTNLNEVTLSGTKISQKEAEKIVKDYPQYSFNLIFQEIAIGNKSNVEYFTEYDPPVWPEFVKEEK